MKITYERDVEHCDVTKYVKEVTITNILPAENSDRLDRLMFEEIGWEAISGRDSHKVGDRVMFIPAESMLPFELGEKLEITKYLSHGRVKPIRLRGNRSEGLIVDKTIVEPYLPYIMKWETKPSMDMQGDALPVRDWNPHFSKFYRMPNILNEPNIFKEGDFVYCSEKIHGTNFRFGYLIHPILEKAMAYVGSHNVVLDGTAKENLYWRIFRERFENKIPMGYVFYAEIFGKGIQHLHYGRQDPDVAIFAIARDGNYVNREEFYDVCNHYELPYIGVMKLRYDGNIETFRKLACRPSTLTDSHIREGIVITHQDHPDVMAKCLNEDYLIMRNKTERH